MVYIAKFPVHAEEKKSSEKEYNHKSKYKTAYGYLTLDKGNRLQFFISLSNKRESMKITIAKHYLYDTLLANLMYKPIPRPRTVDDHLWLNPNARALRTHRDFNQMTPDQMYATFEHALESITDTVINTSDNQQKRARVQFDDLVMRQWKMDLIYTIWQTENFKI